MFTNLKRVVRYGLMNFWRNRWIAQATVGVMALTLFVVITLVLLSQASENILKELRQKVDISIYFKLEADEADILKAKSSIETLPEVKEVQYVSRRDALERFRKRHESNPLIVQSLDELGANPLAASLNVLAKNPTYFQGIAAFVDKNYSALVDKINYNENKEIIERVSSFSAGVERAGLVLSAILVAIVVLVTFNTIRLTIYSVREEISIMRLVGASNWYIRGPFLIEGALYGLIAMMVTTVFFVALLKGISQKLTGFLMGFDPYKFFIANLGALIALELLIGVTLGVVASWFAMRRYLRV